ncbi:hypothetical protein [Streptomyces sp. LN704]|uniref:hypothetical protein n=1 Tax=unclassified Streptomyces TaxID=2593676 RepID=UPI00372430CF
MAGHTLHRRDRRFPADSADSAAGVRQSCLLDDTAAARQDPRSWNAVLTDEGLGRLRKAWPSNLA